MIATNDNNPEGYREAMLKWVEKTEKKRPRNAAQRQLPYAMNGARYIDLLERQGWVCALTGWRFAPTGKAKNRRRPSVDRIDHTKGYVLGNCRIVINGLNSWMNYWGDEMALPIARAIVKRQMETQP